MGFQQENILNKMRETNIDIEFRIMGNEFNIDDVTRELNILPTDFWEKGERRGNGKKYTYTSWNYRIGSKETLDIGCQILKIEKLFFPKEEILCELRKKYDLKYGLDIIIIVENNVVPAIYFEIPIIEFLSKIGGEIDIDTYIN